MADLDEFALLTIKNWDGYCADPILPSTHALATRLNEALKPLGEPDVAPGADGSIGFEYTLPDGSILMLDVLEQQIDCWFAERPCIGSK